VIRFKPLTNGYEWSWFAERNGNVLCSDMQGLVAFDDRGIHAVFIMDTVSRDGCQVHFAVDNPMAIRAGFFEHIAWLVYGKNGLKRMFGLVPTDNPKALTIDAKIGFKEVCRIPDGERDGVDTVVLRLDREDCRYFTGLPPGARSGAVSPASEAAAPARRRPTNTETVQWLN